jgi:predicted RNase H-like nuclease (RuvC/YqgF family)
MSNAKNPYPNDGVDYRHKQFIDNQDDVDHLLKRYEELIARHTLRRLENECEIDRLKEVVEGFRFDIERQVAVLIEKDKEIAFLKRNIKSLDTVLDERNKEIELLRKGLLNLPSRDCAVRIS